MSIVEHLLAFYWVVAAAVLGPWRFKRLKAQFEFRERAFRSHMYRRMLAWEVLAVLLIAALVKFGGVPVSELGLGAPRSWPVAVGLSIAVAGGMLWTSRRQRRKTEERREFLRRRLWGMVPEHFDRHWYAAVSIGGAIAEELVYRGFLFHYFHHHVPHLPTVGVVLTTAAIFGVRHIHQGSQGVGSAALGGLILGAAYAVTGNLLLPIVMHAANNLRFIAVFRPPGRRSKTS